ncbi:hypothetical protein D3C80_1386760 [compost metagenome]
MVGADSAIRDLRSVRGADAEVVVVTLASGKTVVLGVADDPSASAAHVVTANGRTWRWTGPWARLDQ